MLFAIFIVLTSVLEAQNKVYNIYKNKAGNEAKAPSYSEPLPVATPVAMYYKAAYTPTLSTEVDTITAPTSTTLFWSFSVTPNDTLEWSLSGSFTNPQKVITAGTDGFTNFSVSSFPAVYLRRVGVGTVTYSYKAWGY